LIDSVRNTQITTQRLCFPEELKVLVGDHLGPYFSDRPASTVAPKFYRPLFPCRLNAPRGHVLRFSTGVLHAASKSDAM
jgi:hypothetical protein